MPADILDHGMDLCADCWVHSLQPSVGNPAGGTGGGFHAVSVNRSEAQRLADAVVVDGERQVCLDRPAALPR